MLTSTVRARRGRAIPPAPYKPNPSRWGDTGVHAVWIGHSTVLLKIDGVTILTDPVFGQRVGPSVGRVTLVGLRRIVAPALSIAETPRPDIVLL